MRRSTARALDIAVGARLVLLASPVEMPDRLAGRPDIAQYSFAGWAVPHMTAYLANPLRVVGSRSSFVTLWAMATDAIVVVFLLHVLERHLFFGRISYSHVVGDIRPADSHVGEHLLMPVSSGLGGQDGG